MADLFLNFQAPVNEPSINNLHILLTLAIARPVPPTGITVLLNSLGGAVHVGVAAYNFIKSLPMPITFFSLGNVDSIANILFLAGTQRYAVPEATFHLHSSSRAFQGAQSIAAVEEARSSLKSDNDRMASIIARETLLERARMDEIFLQGRTLTALEAKSYNFVREVKPLVMPGDVEIQQVAAVYQ